MSSGCDPLSEVDTIKSMIDSIRPSFAGSSIDQETLEKLELLWIKKLNWMKVIRNGMRRIRTQDYTKTAMKITKLVKVHTYILTIGLC